VRVRRPRAIGKTWLGFNLATLLAEGSGQFLGRLEVRRHARTLYLQGELDEWGSAARWEQLTGIARPLPGVWESFDRARIRVHRRRVTQTVDGVTMSDDFVDATLDGRLEATIVAHGIEVLVIDPWAVYFGGNENSNDEVEEALAKLRDLMLRLGVAVVILHHIRKGTNEGGEPEDLWRGASRLADWASTRVTLLPHFTARKAREASASSAGRRGATSTCSSSAARRPRTTSRCTSTPRAGGVSGCPTPTSRRSRCSVA